jgi:acylphosphatase
MVGTRGSTPGDVSAVDVVVTGRVQGVSFRAYTQDEARHHGVTGWVRNEPDGSVTAHFEGAARSVDAMVAWCRQGPRSADVDHVDVRQVQPTGATGFDIRFG